MAKKEYFEPRQDSSLVLEPDCYNRSVVINLHAVNLSMDTFPADQPFLCMSMYLCC